MTKSFARSCVFRVLHRLHRLNFLEVPMSKSIPRLFVCMLALAPVMTPSSAWAWGEDGHRIVARMAECI